ncbi:MAG: PmoA family protein [Candidatus Latescibacterota bacterium]
MRGEPSTGGGVSCVEQADRIDVAIGKRAFTSYHFGNVWARPFLYPILGPYRLPVTRRLATLDDTGDDGIDHPHHRSFWVAHGEANGADNWSEEVGHGKTVHRSFDALTGGPVLAHICALGDWVSAEGEKVLEEHRCLRIYNLPEWCRVVDMVVTLTATERDVLFGDTKEGGIASVRVTPSMEVRNTGKIENAHGGINEAETWGKQAMWCDYSGCVEGRQVGLTLFDHPDSFRYPTYRHVRDYGLMTANPFGLSQFTNDPSRRGDYTLTCGDAIRFRYRMYLHPGDAKEGNVAEKYHDFINRPVVCVVK